MNFKTEAMRAQFNVLPQRLRQICDTFDKLSTEHNIVPVVTRVSDPVCGESGVHLDYRAIDFRNQFSDGKTLRCLYPVEVSDYIIATITKQYPRTDGKPVIINHSFQGGPFHMHLQIPSAWVTENDRMRIDAFKAAK